MPAVPLRRAEEAGAPCHGLEVSCFAGGRKTDRVSPSSHEPRVPRGLVRQSSRGHVMGGEGDEMERDALDS